MSSSAIDLTDILAFTISLARAAGAKIKHGSATRFEASTGVDEKKNAVDLVTETDQAVEAFVKQEISTRFPHHSFIGEESHAAGEKHILSDDPTWIVDPIDGTTNFVHGFPFSCISIGFTIGGEPVVGVVFNPFLNQLYSGAKGHGSFLNETTRLPLVSPAPSLPSLSRALLGIEWGSDRSPFIMSNKLKSFDNLIGQGEGKAMVRGVRSLGSAALNFCAVASGQLDMYWEIGCWEWDVAAGIVIALEAGGRVFGSKSSDLTADCSAELVTGRKYLVVRGIPEGKEGQVGLAREFYGFVEEWEQL